MYNQEPEWKFKSALNPAENVMYVKKGGTGGTGYIQKLS